MGHQDAFALGRSNLNDFLFAHIGFEGSGMSLSVVSALARVGLDPWQEAGRLAKLPRGAATDGLARLIAAMPASLWPLPDATAVAARLVALLPRQDDTTALARDHIWLGGPLLIAVLLTMAVLATVAARSDTGAAVPIAATAGPSCSAGAAQVNGRGPCGKSP